eukprot:gb/GECG01003914.1/.p1 GENE.gb/GECG01003914.1/~~gb/GECG01003914.1/.p1  ORF type:complete len:371 (+),score=87.01 gb/GECG01003914.1/:1-1113(+)
MLPRLLGKVFYGRKKQPYPVKIDTPHMGQQLAKARDCTAVFPGFGTCMAVRIGWTNFTAKQLYENIMHAIQRIVSKIPQGWSNIQSIYLKSASSTALPLFAQTPASLLVSGENRTNGGASKKDESEESDEEQDDGDEKIEFSDEDDDEAEDDDEDEDDVRGSRIPTIGSRTVQSTASTQRTPAKKRQAAADNSTPAEAKKHGHEETSGPNPSQTKKARTTPTSRKANAKTPARTTGNQHEEAEDTPADSTAQAKKTKTTPASGKRNAKTPAKKGSRNDGEAQEAPPSTRTKDSKVQMVEPEQHRDTSNATTKTPAKSTKNQHQTPKSEAKASRKTSAIGSGKTPKTASKAATTRKYSPRRTRSSTATPKK